MKITATIKRILPIKEVGQNNFKVRELHVETVEQYAQPVSIQFTQDKTSLLDEFKPGDKVNLEVAIRGREVIKEGQEPAIYNTLNCWKIERAV
jgi:riboflavin synthase alpha subunit